MGPSLPFSPPLHPLALSRLLSCELRQPCLLLSHHVGGCVHTTTPTPPTTTTTTPAKEGGEGRLLLGRLVPEWVGRGLVWGLARDARAVVGFGLVGGVGRDAGAVAGAQLTTMAIALMMAAGLVVLVMVRGTRQPRPALLNPPPPHTHTHTPPTPHPTYDVAEAWYCWYCCS